MRASQQITQIVNLLLSGEKVKSNGGCYVRIADRQFMKAHALIAKRLLKEIRESRRSDKPDAEGNS